MPTNRPTTPEGLPGDAGIGRRAFVVGGLAAATAACASSGPSAVTESASSTPTTATTTSVPPARPDVASFVTNGSRTRQQVALTFHVSGERNLVDGLLHALADRSVTATAFMVGSWLEANPDFVAGFVDGGHELANHTYTHPTFESLKADAMQSEIERCRDALVRLAQTPGDWFRTSGTANGVDPPSTNALGAAATAGYATAVGFDVDPADYADPGASVIVERVRAAVRPGSIISLHFGHQGTIDALPGILDVLATAGLAPVDLRTLLAS